ncbi:hypothetical protein BC629DRAFT_52896 [Irpex lacteus]|nr:hypothetical protein BC629DRAFT_52896 [Irpex lacteus]
MLTHNQVPLLMASPFYAWVVSEPTLIEILTGTKILGREKRELSDEWISAQLWIIVKIDRNSVYTIQNANSRTYMDLVKGMPMDLTTNQGFSLFWSYSLQTDRQGTLRTVPL